MAGEAVGHSSPSKKKHKKEKKAKKKKKKKKAESQFFYIPHCSWLSYIYNAKEYLIKTAVCAKKRNNSIVSYVSTIMKEISLCLYKNIYEQYIRVLNIYTRTTRLFLLISNNICTRIFHYMSVSSHTYIKHIIPDVLIESPPFHCFRRPDYLCSPLQAGADSTHRNILDYHRYNPSTEWFVLCIRQQNLN